MLKIRVTENALDFEKIAYNSSWRNFVFVIFWRKTFSTPTRNSTQNPTKQAMF